MNVKSACLFTDMSEFFLGYAIRAKPEFWGLCFAIICPICSEPIRVRTVDAFAIMGFALACTAQICDLTLSRSF